MKKLIVICLGILIQSIGYSQYKVEWQKDIEITWNSFEGRLPAMAEDNLQQYSFACTFDFSFQMANLQFTFTKNFNRYVSAYYMPELSWIEKGELTEELLLMANLDFDLVELYARKFRQQLYQSKNVGSNVNFFNDIHARINREYTDRQSVIQSEIRTRENIIEYLKEEIRKVNIEIEALNEFCKECKPQKKKRK